jgi:hypothetical protein
MNPAPRPGPADGARRDVDRVAALPEGVLDPAAGSPARRQSRLWLAALVVVLVVQLISLYSPEVPGAPQIAGLDKVIHILIFAAPALAALMAGLSAPWVIGILAVHAPVSELIQHFALSHRSGDPFDMMADFVGIAIGVLVFVVWNRRKH